MAAERRSFNTCARWEGHRLLPALPHPLHRLREPQTSRYTAWQLCTAQTKEHTRATDPSYVCIPSGHVREIHIRLQLQASIPVRFECCKCCLFSWQQTSHNFDLQLDTVTKTKQVALQINISNSVPGKQMHWRHFCNIMAPAALVLMMRNTRHLFKQ